MTGAWRAELGVEVAVVNRHGLRQGLPRGPITKASVWSVMPFDDEVVMLRMKGSALARTLAEESAVVGGATRDGGRFWVGGAPLDPERVYSVATTNYLYDDGHLGLRHAVSAERAGDWRAPVIAWTQKQRSSKDAPLERLLRQGNGAARGSRWRAAVPRPHSSSGTPFAISSDTDSRRFRGFSTSEEPGERPCDNRRLHLSPCFSLLARSREHARTSPTTDHSRTDSST